MKRAVLATVLAASSAVLAASGCNSDLDARLALAELSGGCRINSDCADELVCVFERCHQECNTSRDCTADARCVQGPQSRNVCQLPDEQACDAHGNCPGQQVCGVDAECRDGCFSNDECISEQVCSAGTCADTTELGPEGRLAPEPTRPAGARLPCQLDSDCVESLVCVGGACKAECETSRDCASGQRCVEGVCEPTPAPRAECLLNSDCSAEQHCADGTCLPTPELPAAECAYDSNCPREGQHCAQGSCICECKTDTDCAYGWACSDSCACQPDLVLEGDMTVTDGAQVQQLDGVREIRGTLTLKLGSSGIFHLRGLKTVKNLTVEFVSDVEPKVVFDALQEVTGDFLCRQTCVAPRLVTAGTVVSDAPTARELSLPALTTTGKLHVWRNPNMRTVRLASLTTATIFIVDSSPAVATLFAPKLQNVETFTLRNLALDALSFPELLPTKSAAIGNCAHLQLVDLSAAWLQLPGGNPEPTALSLSLSSLPQLTTLKLDQNKKLSSLWVDRTGLTNLDAFSFATLFSADSLNFSSNPALRACHLTKLETDLNAAGWEHSFSQSDNLEGACP